MEKDLVVSAAAAIAQLGEHPTEDLKVPGPIPGLGIFPAPPGDLRRIWILDFQSSDHNSNPRAASSYFVRLSIAT